MSFAQLKQSILGRKDRSRKQNIDDEILTLVEAINQCPSFVTTSSCSGRVLLYTQSNVNKKNTFEWLFVSHKQVKLIELEAIFQKLPSGLVWFREEAMILHVCAASVEGAILLLRLAYSLGFKRSGVISISPKVILELGSTEKVDVPIALDGSLLVDKQYLSLLVKIANVKLKRNHAKIQKLVKLIYNEVEGK